MARLRVNHLKSSIYMAVMDDRLSQLALEITWWVQ